MARDLLEIKPTVLGEATASCGCTFVCCLEQAFVVSAGRWTDKMSMVVVPCRDEHVEVAREVAAKGRNYRTAESLASLMSAMVAA